MAVTAAEAGSEAEAGVKAAEESAAEAEAKEASQNNTAMGLPGSVAGAGRLYLASLGIMTVFAVNNNEYH